MWVPFQAIMSDFGYEMISHDNAKTGVIFKIKEGANSQGWTSPVTIKYPDSFASDGITPAYEKDYVIDLINQLRGKNGQYEPIAKIIANRAMHS
jgi:hypothetical protein